MRDRIEIGLLCLALLVMIGFGAALAIGTRGADAAGTPAPPTGIDGTPVGTAVEVRVSSDTAVPSAGPPRIEVLNGAGTEGLARSATRALRERGFDVVYFGNAPSFERTSSIVLDRGGPIVEGRGVADALGIGEVRSEPDSTLLLEATVVLGADWTPDSVRASPESPGIGDRVRALVAGFGELFRRKDARGTGS